MSTISPHSFRIVTIYFFFASELLHFHTTNRQDECLPIDIAKQNGMTAVYAAISLRYEVRHAAPIGSAIAELLPTVHLITPFLPFLLYPFRSRGQPENAVHRLVPINKMRSQGSMRNP